jgi:nucleoid DNA-binding protein
MDIDLLAKMVKELIVEHDQVGLPGVGTFVAEMIPATFSDKGFTINPPYRRLSFYPSRLEDTLLIDFYAESNQISREASSAYITQYLAELKAVLLERRIIVLPGLGRLRATRENALFFVADEDLDIFPAGVGLEPVSLKSHTVEEEEPVVIDVPAPTIEEEVTPVEVPEAVEEPAAEGDSPIESANDEVVEPVDDEEEPAQDEVAEEPAAEAPAVEEPVVEETTESRKHPAYDNAPRRMQDDRRKRKHGSRFVSWLLVLVALAVLALIAFTVLARVAPDFIDSILYTPDELRIINY